ncbi:IclR family transcriptional regulator [Bradyrhizobium mercantei]|uniref:IclR family transcriptional regulator n=1 Tax=Bradyrhizobium mercantei TaxID=1904807 RepID=UPI0009F9035F|nr:IclR family transcriptional regulator [Bradyrhizobium mercantei]
MNSNGRKNKPEPRSRSKSWTAPRQSDAAFATTLAKGLAVLEAFAPESAHLGNTEVAQRTGLSRPTVARLTHTLAELGYLAYEQQRAKYRLWARALTVAHPLLASMKVRQVARPLMQELANSVRGTVSIGLLDGVNLVYVESARAAEPAAHTPDIGSTIPLPRAAMGRALLSMLSAAELAAIEARFATDLAAIWDTYRDRVREGVRQSAQRGYCVSYGDWVTEIHAAAVPLFRDPEFGRACFAINCGIPAFRLRSGELEAEIAPRLVLLANSIRNAVGRGHDDVTAPVDLRQSRRLMKADR